MMKVYDKINLTMLCDFYELTMGRGYFETDLRNRIAYFDVFFRKVPDGGGFAIAAGLEQIIDYIQELKGKAAVKSGRNPEDVLLIAVTKLHGPDEMNEAIDAGITDIGENKVQEIIEKYDKVKPVRWHLIGHLQTNKVKYIISNSQKNFLKSLSFQTLSCLS